MVDDKTLKDNLENTLYKTYSPNAKPIMGKVRDSYPIDGENKRLIVVTDRISAFDRILGTIPFKRQVLNQIASYWFGITKRLYPNHLIDVPDEQASIVDECVPFKLEMVVRGYLAGNSSTSIYTHYVRGDRKYCGHMLPSGLCKYDKLPEPIVTPTTKAAIGFHDEPISGEDAVAMGLCTAHEFSKMSSMCLDMFEFGSAHALERGLIMADTKYELGKNKNGDIVFIDEIHTPDSTRYWHRASYELFLDYGFNPEPVDKEFLRDALYDMGYSGYGNPPYIDDNLRIAIANRYIDLYELVTGKPFTPNLEPPKKRIARLLDTLS